MTKFYVDNHGRYLGGFDGAEPTAGGIEVPVPPASAAEIWSGAGWSQKVDVPERVAMWAARAVMIEEGVLDQVLAVIDAIEDETARKVAQAKFEYSSTVRRDDPLVSIVIPGLGKTTTQIDAMFTRAKALEEGRA